MRCWNSLNFDEKTMSGKAKTVVWFRRDLRVEDNPALAAASKDGYVLPVFIWCPEEEGQFYPGRVSRWWLKQSLIHLDQTLKSLGVGLVLAKAESSLSALLKIVKSTGATRVVYNHLYDPPSLVRDHHVNKQLGDCEISVHSYNGHLLYEPWEVYDDEGHAFTTFDAYWKKCLSMNTEPTCLLPPRRLVPPPETVESCSIDELGLENELEKSSNALLARGWSPGWSNADKVLLQFISEHLLDYSKNRKKVAGPMTSLLSPYLHFGEISVRKIFQSVRMKQILWTGEGIVEAEESVNLFLKSIGFREYSRYLCFNFPFTHERSFMGHLRHFPWRTEPAHFKAWRQGRTGYPLVDAGMRELWATGWLHNKIRVIVSSFFVKFLLLPWTWGMKYFWDTLLDADLESDILGWQYISGSLPDGQELDRLDCPQIQGSKFDPDGEYVRQWIPELARMPSEWIHHPWDAPSSVLTAAGVELGQNYPMPIVDIDVARERLADAMSLMWEADAATKAQKFNGSAEVVADNSEEIMDIPKVTVRERVACASSSHDQRVPSIQMGDFQERKASKGLDGERINRNNIGSQAFNNENPNHEEDDDLCSTAVSSSVIKTCMSESSEYAVAPCPSISNIKSCGVYKVSDSIGTTPTRPWQELFGVDETQTSEEEIEVQSHA